MTHKLSNDFYYALVSFLMQAKQQVLNISGEFGLTGAQALTLLSIRGQHPQSMSELCRLHDCDASNITGIVDGLEQKGLVTRQPHPNDRRIKIIHLEKDGHAVQNSLINRIAESTPALFSGLSDAEIHQLAKLIQKIHP